MVKTITKIGNSQGVIFDAALLDLTGLRAGDQVAVSVAAGGSIILPPLRKAGRPGAVAATVRGAGKDLRKARRKLGGARGRPPPAPPLTRNASTKNTKSLSMT